MKRKLPLNETVFNTLTPESAYWIGFLMADGNVWGRQLQLALGPKDVDHIQRFKDFLGAGHAICPTKNGAHFYVSSLLLVNALARCGVTPRKSHTAMASEELVLDRDFWRGVVDGDGTVGVYKDSHGYKYPTLVLAGSQALMAQFLAFVQVHAPGKSQVLRQGSIFQVRLQGRRATQMIEVLYECCGELALRRKLEEAREILKVSHLKDRVA